MYSVRVSLCIPLFFFLGGRYYAHDLGTVNGFFHYTYRHILSLFFSITRFLSLFRSRHLVILSVFFFLYLNFFYTFSFSSFPRFPLSLCVSLLSKNSVVLVSTKLDYINYLLITLYYIFWFPLWCLRRFSFFSPLFFFSFFPSLNFFFFSSFHLASFASLLLLPRQRTRDYR